MTGLKNWTISKYKKYVTCPRQLGEVVVKRNFQETFPADQQQWGDAVHRAMQYSVMNGMPLPSNMPYGAIVEQVRAAPGEKFAELQLAIDRAHNPCEYFSPNWWHRGQIDLLILNGVNAVVMDWKTGKRKDEPEQLMTNALLVFAHYPRVQQVSSSYIWLGAGGPPSKLVFVREKIPEYWLKLTPVLEQMDWSIQNDVYPPRPSGLCKQWCCVLSCPHNGLSKK